jgi:hypothetical protein
LLLLLLTADDADDADLSSSFIVSPFVLILQGGVSLANLLNRNPRHPRHLRL